MQDRSSGFSLIELMVTLTILVIVTTLATPSIQTYVSRSILRAISADFTLSMQRARTEAINRNECVAICLSNTSGTSTPQCSTTGQNWGVGWLVFRFPSCGIPQAIGADNPDATPAKREVVLFVREGVSERYTLNNSSSVRAVIFNARGLPSTSATQFNLQDTQALTGEASFNRTFCMDMAGRVLILAYGAACP